MKYLLQLNFKMHFFLAVSPLKRPDEKSQLQFSQTSEPNPQPAINSHSLNRHKHEHFTILPLTNYHPSLNKTIRVPVTHCIPSSSQFWYPVPHLAAWVSSTDSKSLRPNLTSARLLQAAGSFARAALLSWWAAVR